MIRAVGWLEVVSQAVNLNPSWNNGWMEMHLFCLHYGNVCCNSVSSTELCLETVEHLPKPQARLHWESYDLILFQQCSRPGPGKDKLFSLSAARGSDYVSQGTQAGMPCSTPRLEISLGCCQAERLLRNSQLRRFPSLSSWGLIRNKAGERETGLDCKGL